MNNKIIDWDTYFMGLAQLSALRSKDPSTQVGAVIINPKKRIVGMGYNGFPRGCEDDQFPWNKTGNRNETKYPYVVHAELNAILNSIQPLDDCTLYVTLFPCNECAKAIIQSGIKHIIYQDIKSHHQESNNASKRMLEAAGVSYHQLKENIKIMIEKTVK